MSPRESPSSPRRVAQRRGTGYLQLRVQPGSGLVYVDGFYVGSVDGLRGLVPVEEGPHRVEVRTAGYETLAFDVRVVADATITYRADLARIREAPTPALVPAIPKTFFVIPNCYAGDTPPVQSRLPASCDVANVRTIPPVVNAIRPARPR